jgi:hypothetical protein
VNIDPVYGRISHVAGSTPYRAGLLESKPHIVRYDGANKLTMHHIITLTKLHKIMMKQSCADMMRRHRRAEILSLLLLLASIMYADGVAAWLNKHGKV